MPDTERKSIYSYVKKFKMPLQLYSFGVYAPTSRPLGYSRNMKQNDKITRATPSYLLDT